MHKIALFAPLLLAACTTAPGETPVHGETAGHKCDNARAGSFIGQPGTSEAGAAIMKATNSGTLRWAWPNSALTMDFRVDRVTVVLASDGKVARIDCG
jgi:peptidase inhibitor I78 family protein